MNQEIDACSLVSLVALPNKRRRYFIPSHFNFFGCFSKYESGINVQNVMLDSGCNTLLLPMDESTLDVLIEHYSGSQFFWSIIKTGGSGDFSSLVLVISASCPMTTNLFADVFHLSIKLDHLRFHISFQDAKNIISKRLNFLREADILVLEEFCRVVELIERKTGHTIGKRRNYALLGQMLMRQEFTIVQYPYITIFVHSYDKLDWNHVDDVSRALWLRFIADFDSNEILQNIEDLDHDGEDPLGWIYDAVDEIL
jgi:hypothetical protein